MKKSKEELIRDIQVINTARRPFFREEMKHLDRDIRKSIMAVHGISKSTMYRLMKTEKENYEKQEKEEEEKLRIEYEKFTPPFPVPEEVKELLFHVMRMPELQRRER
jgi:hypothetical protein